MLPAEMRRGTRGITVDVSEGVFVPRAEPTTCERAEANA